jgi:hypothetical protein
MEANNHTPRFIHDEDYDARKQVLKITEGSTRFCFRHHISAGTIELGSNKFMVILNARYPVPGMSNAWVAICSFASYPKPLSLQIAPKDRSLSIMTYRNTQP